MPPRRPRPPPPHRHNNPIHTLGVSPPGDHIQSKTWLICQAPAGPPRSEYYGLVKQPFGQVDVAPPPISMLLPPTPRLYQYPDTKVVRPPTPMHVHPLHPYADVAAPWSLPTSTANSHTARFTPMKQPMSSHPQPNISSWTNITAPVKEPMRPDSRARAPFHTTLPLCAGHYVGADTRLPGGSEEGVEISLRKC